jgi:uncharacterized protein
MIDLAALKVAGPTVTVLTRPFWDAASEGHLLVQRCGDCGRAVLYPRAICPGCWSGDLSWEEASGEGWLRSFSVVHKPGHAGWLPAVPYVVGLVELVEGPTMLSLVHAEGATPRVGSALRLAPTDIGGRVLPAFRMIGGRET